MGVFQRISDIVSANLNDMVERFEDPEQMLRQAIREMEEAVRKVKPDVAKAMANEKTLARELASNEGQVAVWDARARTSLEVGDDNTARKAIGRKQEYAKIVAALRDQQAAALDASGVLRRQLEAMQAKLAEAQRRLGTLVARRKAAEIRGRLAETAIDPRLDQAAFVKFDRLARKVERAEAEAEAMAELARSEWLTANAGGGPYAEPDGQNVAIEAELLEMKKSSRRDP